MDNERGMTITAVSNIASQNQRSNIKAPNAAQKHQIPNTKFQTNSTDQIQMIKTTRFEFSAFWSFEFVCDLEFGAWNFRFQRRVICTRRSSRSASLRLIVSRLSCCCLPRATPSSS